MTEEEQQEMAAYHAARKQAEELFEAERSLKALQMNQWEEEDEGRAKANVPKLSHSEVVRHSLRELGVPL